jgi:O-antigen ligase
MSLSVVVAGTCALPLVAAFLHQDIAPVARIALAILLALSAALPLGGLLVLTALVPFALFVQAALGGVPPAAEVSDAALFAFASGASLRFASWSTLRPARLAAPALVMAAAVLASTLAELASLQAISPRAPVWFDAWRHVTTDYWLGSREFGFLHHAWRWGAWLAAAVYAERIVAGTKPPLAFAVWMAVGIAAALVAVTQLMKLLTAVSLDAAWNLLPAVRFTALHPDLNAAGSFFALFLVPAFIVGVRRRAWWYWGVVTPLVGVAFFCARSRAAMVSVMLVTGGAYLKHVIDGNERLRRLATPVALALVAGVLVAVAAGATYVLTNRSNVAPHTAVEVRLQMLQVGLESVRRHPVLGVGPGEYIPATRRFITPEMALLRSFAPAGENAHNNYLQIAVELGVPAVIVFLWLVVPTASLTFRREGPRMTPEASGMSLGVAAFLLSACLGHPLLVPQVGTMFFAALGIAAGLAPRRIER